jgi:apolipoprotein N-acyltransferase
VAGRRPRRDRELWIRVAACVAGGLALAASFPPYDVGPLAFVALLPLLWAWRGATPRRAALYGLVFGLAFFGVLLEWSRYFGAVAIAPLVIAEACYLAGAGALIAAFDRRGLRSPLLVGAVWVVVESLRGRWPLGGLPWGETGVALHDVGFARALASFGGVALVSFLVVCFQELLLDGAIAWQARRRTAEAAAGAAETPRGKRADAPRPGLRTVALMLAGMVVLVGLADALRYEPTVTGHIKFALLQGNDQDRNLTQGEVDSDYLTRRHLALAATLHGHYDLIVFPESSLEQDPTTDPELRSQLVAVGAAHGAVVVANARVRAPDGGVYNANVAYSPNGRFQGVYAKQHLVPFGEYVPWRSQLSFISELQQIPYDYEKGHSRLLYHAAGHPFGTVICFESAFSPLVRSYVKDGAQLIVVSTNNRSYRRSGLAAQHLALSQMRAAETARPVLHASISGITGVIDPDGNVHDTSKLFVNKVTTGTVATTTGETPYVRFGDWVVALCGLGIVAAAAVGFRRVRRARTAAGGSAP